MFGLNFETPQPKKLCFCYECKQHLKRFILHYPKSQKMLEDWPQDYFLWWGWGWGGGACAKISYDSVLFRETMNTYLKHLVHFSMSLPTHYIYINMPHCKADIACFMCPARTSQLINQHDDTLIWYTSSCTLNILFTYFTKFKKVSGPLQKLSMDEAFTKRRDNLAR
jgi:hypothetical protein